MYDRQVDEYIRRLKREFVNRWRPDKAFGLADRELEDDNQLPANVVYDPDAVESLWSELQMNLHLATPTVPGQCQHFPPITHKVNRFNDERGLNGDALVDDTNLRHLLQSSKEQEVVNAIDALAEIFARNIPVQITRERSSMQGYFDTFGNGAMGFFRELKALEYFGGMRVFYTGNGSSIEYPRYDRLYPNQQATHRIPPRTSTPDCNFFVDLNSDIRSDRFSLLTVELKNIAHKITPGLHLKGPRYYRPGTDDQAICHGLKLRTSANNIKAARKRFDMTAGQAFHQAMMNKSELMAMCDGAGMHLMSFDASEVEDLDRCIADLEAGRGDRHTIKVHYDKVHCSHWEEGSYFYGVLCAIVNQLFAKVDGLREYLDTYGNAARAGARLLRPRNVRFNRETHRRLNMLYDKCARYFNEHQRRRQRRRLAEELGTTGWVERNLDDFEVHEVLQEGTDEQSTLVYKLSGEQVNGGRKFVAKALLPDDKGDELFFNEIKVYRHLMSQSNEVRLWPQLFEYGMMTIEGCGYHYLGIELLEGKEASRKEYEACARTLRNLFGVDHNDLRPLNFVTLPGDGDGRRVVKALDFGYSFIEEKFKQKSSGSNKRKRKQHWHQFQ